jgi:hypothetical protein
MPLTHLHDPVNGIDIPLEQAPEYFEHQGLIPMEVTQALLNTANDPRRLDEHLSPSVADPDTTCRREQIIRRFMPYSLDPMVTWEAMEGTVWHNAFSAMSEGNQDWFSELPIPGPDDEDLPHVKRTTEDVLVVETLPGIWLSGVVDRVSRDFKTLVDHKTQRFSKRDWGFKSGWKLQINLYVLMIKRTKDVEPEQLAVWRTYRGSYERDRTFRYFPCPKMNVDEIDSKIRKHCEDLQKRLVEAKAAYDAGDQAAIEDLIKNTPMDGQTMFNGKKCSQYCSVQKVCFGLEGLPTF